jgi:multiple sugar transport system permease protein
MFCIDRDGKNKGINNIMKKGKLILVISIGFVLLWTLLPIYCLIINSLSPISTLGSLFPQTITFEYYTKLFRGSGTIYNVVVNSFIVSIVTVIITILIGVPGGYGVSRWTKGKYIFTGLFILRMIPPISFLIPWFFILWKLNLLDTRIGLIIAYVRLPFTIVLMKGFFDSIPIELEEAAKIDGATFFQTFLKIIVPLSLNGVVVVALFTFIYSYFEFMYAVVLTRVNAKTFSVYIAGFSTEHGVQYQSMLATSFIGMIPMILLYTFFQKYIVSGLKVGLDK